MIFNNPEPKNLEEWLEMATKGIAAPGKERITREIEVHFMRRLKLTSLRANRSRSRKPMRFEIWAMLERLGGNFANVT